MKIFKKFFVAGSVAAMALTACSMVDEYDQELVELHEKAEQDVKDSIAQVEQDKKDSIQKVDDATCDSVFVDPRDSVSYNIIRIYDAKTDGGKAHCWFKENLAYDDGNAECYEGLSGASRKCKTYGRLYQGSKLVGVCPEGTHVATFADWQHLYKTQNIEKVGAQSLKTLGDDDWASGTGKKATDEFGFSALAAGAFDEKLDDGYFSVGEAGFWWIVSGDKMSSISLHRDDDKVAFQSDVNEFKNLFYSVRCVIGKEADPTTSEKDEEDVKPPTQEELNEITNVTITGYAQKGPFAKNTVVRAYQIENGENLKQIGKAFLGEVSGDDGKFTVRNITLSSQYALLEADGYYKSEITGKISTSPIVLKTITDLTKREKVNINLLTHLEYDRVFYLVTERGMGFTSAKQTAEKELFKIFHIDGSVFKTIAEDMDVAGNSDADAALVALSIIALGGNTEGEVLDLLKSISMGIAQKGALENDSLIARMADWVAKQEVTDHFKSIRKNVGSNVGNFEKHLTNFWVGVYGMDSVSCASDEDEGRVAFNSNKESKTYKDSRVRYVCKNAKWEIATDTEKDLYLWKDGEEGDFRNGSVNYDSVYVFEDGAWRLGNALDSSLKLGGCILARNNEYKKAADDSWYVCDNQAWKLPSQADPKGVFARFTPEDKERFVEEKIFALDTMIDPRDGKVYKTITIDSVSDDDDKKIGVIWMVENLNYADSSKTPNLKGGSWCYDDRPYNCEIAGRLYSYTAAMNLDSEGGVVSDEENHQGICPDGWRLPSGSDYTNIELLKVAVDGGADPSEAFVRDNIDFQSAVKNLWNKNNGTNSTGLSFIPSGMRSAADGKVSYTDAGVTAMIWQAYDPIGDDVWAIYVADDTRYGGEFGTMFLNARNNAVAVRCIKDIK